MTIAAAEQHVVRGRARLLEFLDRQIVDADDLDAVLDQVFRPRFGDADEVGVEVRRAPQAGIVGLDQDPDVFGEIAGGQVIGRDALPCRELDDRARPHNMSRGSASLPGPSSKMAGRVDVGAAVRTQMQRRDVRAVAVGDPLDGFEAVRRVAGIGREVDVERHRDIDEFHGQPPIRFR